MKPAEPALGRRLFQVVRTALLLLGLLLQTMAVAAPPQNAPQAPRIWLGVAKRFSATFIGSGAQNGQASATASSLAQNNAVALLLGAGKGEPLALAKGDFDRDGVEDLVVGYKTSVGGAFALYRGNLDALAPQTDGSF